MDQQFRMRDITQKTGLSKSTIQYYLSLGLLPEPVEKSKNMAYYPALYLEIVPVIRYLQQKTRLSLSVIKQLIDAIGFERVSIENAMHYYETFLSPFGYGQNAGVYTREELRQHSGLELDDIGELENCGLLFASTDGLYSHADATVAGAYKNLKDCGISYSDIEELTITAQKITHEVHTLYHKKARSLDQKEEQKLSELMIKELRVILNYLINQHLLLIYKEEIK